MKKLLFVMLFGILTLCVSAQNSSSSSTLSKTEVHQINIAAHPDLVTEPDEYGEGVAAPTGRHVYSQIGWYEFSTGCIGYTTTWRRTFLGIEYGPVHETSTYVACP
jgi:hypothetical protein